MPKISDFIGVLPEARIKVLRNMYLGTERKSSAYPLRLDRAPDIKSLLRKVYSLSHGSNFGASVLVLHVVQDVDLRLSVVDV